MKFAAPIGVVLAVLGVSSSAHASYGTVTGDLKFYNQMMGYCPSTGRDCTGSLYPQNQYQTNQGIRNMEIRIVSGTNPLLQIGAGVTDWNGHFQIQWNLQQLPQGSVTGRVVLSLKHAAGRFRVYNGSGGIIQYYGPAMTLTSGTTSNWGTINWGTAATPDPYLHVYEAAMRDWEFSIQYSGTGWNYFSNVVIRAFNHACGGISCAGSSQVDVDDTDPLVPYNTVVNHELGHVVSDMAIPTGSARCGGAAFNYANLPGWHAETPEWGCVALEEAYATFIGDVSRWWEDAVESDTCTGPIDGSGVCVRRLEPSSGTICGGTQEEGRWPLTVERILWDLMDVHADSVDGHTDTSARWYGEIVDNMYTFVPGTADHQRDEPAGTDPNPFDGKGIVDYAYLFQQAHFTADLTPLRMMNCNPPGD